VFTQPKSAKSRRTIALSPSTALTLRTYKETQEKLRSMLGSPHQDTDLVFCDLNGNPYRPNTITRAWATMTARAGVKKIRLHDARHTHASLMLKRGIHPKVVQERLGHASITMTLDTYSHVVPGLQEAAAESFDRMVLPTEGNEAVSRPLLANY
jgi:integrase